MRKWQRDIVRDLNRQAMQANQECECTNNGDYCDRCNARLELAALTKGRSLTVEEIRYTIAESHDSMKDGI